MSLFAETLSVEISPFAKAKANDCTKKNQSKGLHSGAGGEEAKPLGRSCTGEVHGGLTPRKGLHPRAGQGLLSMLGKKQK